MKRQIKPRREERVIEERRTALYDEHHNAGDKAPLNSRRRVSHQVFIINGPEDLIIMYRWADPRTLAFFLLPVLAVGLLPSAFEERYRRSARSILLLGLSGEVAEAQKKPESSFSETGRALKRMIDAGIPLDDVGRVVKSVAFESTFNVLNLIDESADPDAEDDDLPGWTLIETEAEGDATGRLIVGLHEDLY